MPEIHKTLFVLATMATLSGCTFLSNKYGAQELLSTVRAPARQAAIPTTPAITALPSPVTHSDVALYPNETPELRALLEKYAVIYDIPVALLHRLAIRESTHRPWARNGPYYGLLQILPATARSMGHTGTAEDLMDAETNIKYAGKYLRGAWLVSGGDMDAAIMWYARGYYYEAKRLGLLNETGLR